MPEIPEMEIYKNYLKQYVVDRKIMETTVNRERSINVDQSYFRQRLIESTIDKVERWGKYIVIKTDNGKSLLAHMMLDGRIYLETKGQPVTLPGKSHVSLVLDNDTILHFCEMRLGYVKLLDPSEVEVLIKQLGIDPLRQDYNRENFQDILERKKGMIKPLLMDQKWISGIGNAYSNEVLFESGILPERKVPTLSGEEVEKLFLSIPVIMEKAIAKGGYIEQPFAYWDNLSGGFIPYFMVYDRTNQPCYRCGNFIHHKIVGGRNAYFCQVCQE